MQPEYLVIASADLQAAMDTLASVVMVLLIAVWAAGVNWCEVEWRWRRFRRRQRLRAIRDRRLGLVR